jgi:polyphosphate kinase 2 (PPK2 family)
MVRVHPEILNGRRLPVALLDEKSIWQDRYRSIADFEGHLYRNGTRIIRFFLHILKEEQRKRSIDRIHEPEKSWKFSAGDIVDRGFWKQYMQAYEACLSAANARVAPWYVVPADDKKNARLIVSKVVLDALKALEMHYPKTDAKSREELLSIGQQL